MTALRREAHQIVDDLSEDVLIDWVNLFHRIAKKKSVDTPPQVSAFDRLEACRKATSAKIPKDFDPEHELAEARSERYGRFD